MMRLENVLSVESIRRNPASDGQSVQELGLHCNPSLIFPFALDAH